MGDGTSGFVETVIQIPPGVYDSVEVDATITTDGRHGYGVDASVSMRPVGTDTWPGGVQIGHADAERGTVTVTDQRVTLGTSAPEDTPLEMLLACSGNGHGRAHPHCVWSNLRFYRDTPGWRFTDVSGGRFPTDWVFADITGTYHEGIEPIDGAFMAIEAGGAINATAGYKYGLRGPIVQFPSFSATDVLSASMRWTRIISGEAPHGVSGVLIQFIPLEEEEGEPIELLKIPTGEVSTPWTTTVNEPRQSAMLSGKRGQLRILVPRGYYGRIMGIDDLNFYLNGHPIFFGDAVDIPPDQLVGKCPCDTCGQAQHVHGDPVNTCKGSFVHHATALMVASSGPPLDLSRTYVSMLADPDTYPVSALGPGWSHQFAHALTLPDQGGGEADTIIYESPTGNRLRFQVAANGTFAPYPGIYATLASADDGYTLTLRNQTVLRFDATGRLVEQRTPTGHTQSLTYHEETGTIQDGQLERVTDDASGRALAFQYRDVADAPRLSSVRDTGGRQVDYTYTANGDLATVTDLRGGVQTYTYTDNHLLTSITDALNVTQISNTYDDENRVVEQVDAVGLTTTYAYADTDIGTSTTITMQHPDGSTEVLVDHYRADGTLAFQERDGQLQRYQTFDTTLTPSTVVDGNGAEVLLTNNNVGLPTQITSADGQETTLAYRADHRPTQITTPNQITTAVEYDEVANPNRVNVQGDNLELSTAYTYTDDNRLAQQQTPDGVITDYAHNDLGQVTRMTVGAGTSEAITTTYGYDTLGRVVTTTVGVDTALERVDVTQYNDDDTIARIIQNYVDGTYDTDAPDEDLITDYGYDLLGRSVWIKDALGQYDVTHYNEQGRVDWTAQNLMPFEVDDTGLPRFQPFDPANPDQNVATLYAYDGLGRTTLVTETGLLSGTFDPATRTFSESTERVTRTEYDALSRPVTMTMNYRPDEPAGPDVNVQTVTQYDGAGNVTWQQDALGRWTHTEYDVLNRPVTVTLNFENGDPLTVDEANQGWAASNDTDIVQVNTYRPDGQVAETIENYIDGVFDPADTIHDRKIVYQYDALGREQQTIQNYVDGEESSDEPDTDIINETTYDSAGRMQGTRNPLGRWTSQQYDELSRVSATIQNCRNANGDPVAADCISFDPANPDRNVPYSNRYDALGRAYATIDALGHVTWTSYDGAGRRVATVQNYDDGTYEPATPDTDLITRRAYDVLGRVTAATDPLGATSRTSYDALGQTIATTDAEDRTTEMGYDGTGTLRWTTTPDGRLMVMLVDGLGRVTSTIQNYQDGAVADDEPVDQDLTTQTIYDTAGRIIETRDPANRRTVFAYDLRDNLLSVTENAAGDTCPTAPCNVVTQYRYDRAGNQTAVIDARGVTTRRLTYDALDRQVSWRDALDQVTVSQYDRIGRLLVQDDPRGPDYDARYSYDGQDRVTAIQATELDEPITMAYNALGWRTTLNDGTGTTNFMHDAVGRITEVTSPVFSRIGYGYNARGQRTQLTYPDGLVVDYTYFNDGQLRALVQDEETLVQYGYDDAGRLATLNRANGMVTTYAHDDADRIIDLHTTMDDTGSTVSRFQYTVDRLGLRQSVTEQLTLPTASGQQTTGTDLLQSTDQAPERVPTSTPLPTATPTNTVVPPPPRPSVEPLPTHTPTATPIPPTPTATPPPPPTNRTITYAYDGLLRLTSAEEAPGTVYAYAYDLAGNRTEVRENDTLVQQHSYNDANQVVGWSYDAAGNLLSDGVSTYGYDALSRLTTHNGTTYQYNGDGVLMRTGSKPYAQDLAAPLPQVLQDGPLKYIYGIERVVAVGHELQSWYINDALGSVRQHVDGTQVAGATSYDPWGSPTSEAGWRGVFGFTGELERQGLVHLRARWYDPAHGTLISEDPWQGCPKTPYSLHPYQYAYADPIRLTDPSGRCVVSLYFRPAYPEGAPPDEFWAAYHADVIVNDCDGLGQDESRLCDRDPANTIKIFWGGPEISDDRLGGADRALGAFRLKKSWGQVRADSNVYADIPPKDREVFPPLDTLVKAMGDRDIGTEHNILTVLFDSEPCDKYVRKMEHFKQLVMRAELPYHPGDISGNGITSGIAYNSNSVAQGYLLAAGITPPNILNHKDQALFVPEFNPNLYIAIWFRQRVVEGGVLLRQGLERPWLLRPSPMMSCIM